jgi:hypothetical protein
MFFLVVAGADFFDTDAELVCADLNECESEMKVARKPNPRTIASMMSATMNIPRVTKKFFAFC